LKELGEIVLPAPVFLGHGRRSGAVGGSRRINRRQKERRSLGTSRWMLDIDENRRDRNRSSGGLTVEIFAKEKNGLNAGYK
jgi:hypothetical protein